MTTTKTAADSRGNFLSMMRGEGCDRAPMLIEVTPPVADRIECELGVRDPAEAFGLDVQGVTLPYPGAGEAWRRALGAVGISVPDGAAMNDQGFATLAPQDGSTGEAYHFAHILHPLAGVTSVEQLALLPWMDAAAWCEQIEATVALRIVAVHATGRVAMAHLECTIFEFSWYARGMDNLFMDLVDDNGIGAWLLDYHTERSSRMAAMCARLGCDVIRLGDDIGTQKGMLMSPSLWREQLKPRLAKVIAAVREAQTGPCCVWYHSDGDVRAVIDDLIEVGVDMLNPVQPECMPVREVVAQYRDRLAFSGMIGTQTTMPFGSPDEVRAAVEELVALARDGVRLIIAPTHVLEPDVPWENVMALVGVDRRL